MALSVPPAPPALAARSMLSDRRTGRTLLIAFVLARTSLRVLMRRASMQAAGSIDAVAGAVDRSRVPGRQASPTVLPQEESTALRDHIGSLDPSLEAGEGRPLGDRRFRSAAATPTMSSTLAVVGLIGLLGVCGAADSIVHSVTGPVRRAVRVLQAPEEGRRGRRLRLTTLHELQSMSRAVVAAGHDPFGAARETGADARSLSVAAEGPTATSGPPSSSAEEIPTPAGVVSTVVEQVPAVNAARTPTARSVATTRYTAGRSRALGPTTALWHAVELDRLVGATGGACETTVCGSLVRLSTEQTWPVPARDVCPACSTLAH